MDFKLNDDNLVLKKCYNENKNYKVFDVGNSDICYIFFSSNGIYFPNELDKFKETIVVKNRYEWWGVGHSREVQNNAGRIIYVRDIYKQYYVKGINKELCSIDLLCDKLKELSEGKRIITCGTSSGGYMAVIVGVKLQAECVFSFGGQWSLEDRIDKHFFLKKYEKEANYNKYYNITELVKNTETTIYYFYSAMNEEDKNQVKLMVKSENIHVFAMKSREHGWLLFNNCYRRLIIKNIDEMNNICKKYENKKISQRKICFDLLNNDEALIEIKNDIIRNHKSINILFEVMKNKRK